MLSNVHNFLYFLLVYTNRYLAYIYFFCVIEEYICLNNILTLKETKSFLYTNDNTF